MLRLIILLLIVAGAAAFFTRPGEPVMRDAADAVLSENAEQALENLDIGGFAQSGAASVAGERTYTNYYLASRYTVSTGGEPVVQCWGAFTQVKCDGAEPAA